MASLVNFTKYLILIFLKLFQKTKKKEILPHSFYKATIISISKPEEDITKKENYSLISLINIDAKISNRILKTKFSSTLEASVIIPKWELSLGSKCVPTYTNQKKKKKKSGNTLIQ